MRKIHPVEWENLQKQKKKDKDAGEFICNVCKEHFVKNQQLKDHRRHHHNKEELKAAKPKYDTYICSYCDIGHPSFAAFNMHWRRYH